MALAGRAFLLTAGCVRHTDGLLPACVARVCRVARVSTVARARVAALAVALALLPCLSCPSSVLATPGVERRLCGALRSCRG